MGVLSPRTVCLKEKIKKLFQQLSKFDLKTIDFIKNKRAFIGENLFGSQLVSYVFTLQIYEKLLSLSICSPEHKFYYGILTWYSDYGHNDLLCIPNYKRS